MGLFLVPQGLWIQAAITKCIPGIYINGNGLLPYCFLTKMISFLTVKNTVLLSATWYVSRQLNFYEELDEVIRVLTNQDHAHSMAWSKCHPKRTIVQRWGFWLRKLESNHSHCCYRNMKRYMMILSIPFLKLWNSTLRFDSHYCEGLVLLLAYNWQDNDLLGGLLGGKINQQGKHYAHTPWPHTYIAPIKWKRSISEN